MSTSITLYGMGTSRSARCRWTLAELGLAYEYVEDRNLFHSDELRKLHPQGKMPAAVINGEPLFESAAICEHLSDIAGGNALIGQVGSRARALHSQWVSFVLTELEAYLWSNAKHTSFYPEERRVADVLAPNNDEIRGALSVLNDTLASQSYLVEDAFSVTDIIASWAINWARRSDKLEPFPHLSAYLERLLQREHCMLNPE